MTDVSTGKTNEDEALQGPAWDLTHGPLRVHADARHLVHADGTPFLWLADTAWELFHRTTREEACFYLDKRRAQGFTVIQAVALAELDGLRVPNSQGHLPLVDGDPARPDVRAGEPDYWTHVDLVFDEAQARGLTIALLPTWGDKVGPVKWGIGPEVFTEENAQLYGRFLGRRYAHRDNLVWVIGGDRHLVLEGRDFRPIWRALVQGIKQGESDAAAEGKAAVPHLMTLHPVGGQSSSLWFHEETWLDFNMLQSGHARRADVNYEMIRADLARSPAKPVLDGEPRYEDHPIDFNVDNGWFDDHDVRMAAYHATFAGACGHTYGCHDVWQMFDAGRAGINRPRRTWKEALDLPGAWDMRHLRSLLLSRPMLGRMTDPSLVHDGQDAGTDHVEACRDADGTYAFVYLPTGKPASVYLSRLRVPDASDRVRASWFDPRTGAWRPGDERVITRETIKQTYAPPAAAIGRGHDWVLVLDRVD